MFFRAAQVVFLMGRVEFGEGVATQVSVQGGVRRIQRAGIGSEHHELRKHQPGAISDIGRGCERGRAIARSPKMNEPRTCTP